MDEDLQDLQDDPELALALALSLAEANGQQVDQGAAAALAAALSSAMGGAGAPAAQAPAPPPPQQPPPTAAPPPQQPQQQPAPSQQQAQQQLAAQLAQAMAQALQAAGGFGAAAPAAAPAAPPAAGAFGGGGDAEMDDGSSGQWEDEMGNLSEGSWEEELGADAAAAAGPGGSAGGASAAAALQSAALSAPAWVDTMHAWWSRNAACANSPATAPKGGLPEALKAMGVALGMPVASGLDAESGVAPAAGSLLLPMTDGPDGTVTVTPASMDTLVSTWASRRASAAAAAGAGGQLQQLVTAFAAAAAPSAAGGDGALLVALLRARLAHRAVVLLQDDEDDLFYETGRYHSWLMAAMASGGVGEPFLGALMREVTSKQGAQRFEKLLRDSFGAFSKLVFEEGQGALEGPLIRLDLATRETLPLLSDLAGCLGSESLSLPRRSTEAGCIMGPLLGMSTMLDPASLLRTGKVVSRAREVFVSLRGYPGNQGDATAARHLLENYLSRVHDAAHQVMMRLIKVKGEGIPASAGREAVMGWLAAVADANAARLGGGEMGALRSVGLGASDGFCVNLAAVLLRMARPFVQGALQGSPKFADLFSKHLGPGWYTSQRRRRRAEISGVPVATLAGDRGIAEEEEEGAAPGPKALSPLAQDPAAAATEVSFIADVFFLTQRHLHASLMPAVHRHNKLLDHFYHSLLAQGVWPQGARVPPLEWALAGDCALPALAHPEMAVDAVQFCALEASWLASLLADPTAAAIAFRSIPEYVVGDLADWLSFVILQGHADMLASVNIAVLMRSLVALLEHPDKVKSLLVVSKVVHLLLVMLSPQMQVSKRADVSGGAFGSSYMRPGEAALVAAVLGAPATRELLVPALMRVYGQADFVVGLDVDRDSFDKFSMRHDIDMLLEELWRDAACKDAIRAVAGKDEGVFSEFLSAVLNDLMYLFKDALERLADIKALEDSMGDKKAWAALGDREREDKNLFLENQKRMAKSYMSLSITTLRMLDMFAGDPATAAPFMKQPLLGRSAYAALHFTELLVGPRCAKLAVKDPQRFHFDRSNLMGSMAKLVAQLGARQEFVAAMVAEPDYEAATLHAGVALLTEHHQYALGDALEAVAKRAATAATAAAAAGGAGLASAAAATPSKRRRAAGESAGGAEEDGAAAAAAAAAAGGEAMAVDGASPADAAGAGDSSAALVAAAAGGGEAAIDALVASWALPGPGTYEEAEGSYKEALGELSVGVFDATAPGAYNSHFSTIAAQPEGDTAQKMRRLGQEFRKLRGATALPLNAAAAIFVRQDDYRPDKVRAIISGPSDTPYEGGLFVFDIYFPAGYPQVPLLMVIETTGEGRARFNPNLYADGKVCLSLLGTFHGANAAEKWNPKDSSLYQVLLSVQGLILIEDPYFNEPSHEVMRGKAEGTASSVHYSAEIRLATLRWAMLAHLKHPPPGFEDVVRGHFRSLRSVIMRRMARWLKEAASSDAAIYGRMLSTAQELRAALAAL